MILFVSIYKVETSGDEEDLNSILTRTSRKVALVKRSNVPSDPELHHKRQIPLKQDTLIRYGFHTLFAVFFSLMITLFIYEHNRKNILKFQAIIFEEYSLCVSTKWN